MDRRFLFSFGKAGSQGRDVTAMLAGARRH